jgi:hypothetical protein
MDSLAAYLSSLSPDQLAGVIARRPEAQLPPEPRTFAALAARLSVQQLSGHALIGLTRPEFQVAEALAALGDGCSRSELAAALGVADDDNRLAEVLDRLAEHALVWPDGGRLRMVALDQLWPNPMGLGAPLSAVLGEQRVDDLRRIARELGLRPGTQKSVMVRVLADWLAVGENIRQLCATASPETQELLSRLAWEGPYLDEYPYLYGRGGSGPAGWAVERGLIVSAGHWDAPLQMPCEVALALRGPDYRLPFDPLPPANPTVPVDGEAVEREAGAAAGAAVVRVAALLEECGKTPIALLKTGGVGVRELRRLGKSIGDSPEHVRFWLELGVATGLVGLSEAGLLPTEAFDEWRERQPAEQLFELIEGWLFSEGVAFQRPSPDTPALPALVRIADSPLIPTLRGVVLEVAAALPLDAAVASIESVVALAEWLSPATAEDADDLAALIDGLWREAQALGVVAHGSASQLGRALAAKEPEQVVAAAARLIPAAEETVLLQADLTAVAIGTPSSALASLLDGAADRESRSGAWTWRFSAASVRRAFDAGTAGDELLAALREVASGGRLPQPLEYLIADVARRHGAIRVRPVACCLRCDDPTLLSEILQVKGLAKLGLTALAPTVLASAKPIAETMAALRAAGYAPAGEHADGTVAVERPPRQRAARPELPVPAEALSDLLSTHSVPDYVLEDLFEASSGQLSDELLAMMTIMRPGGPPPTISEPEQLARKLLGRT